MNAGCVRGSVFLRLSACSTSPVPAGEPSARQEFPTASPDARRAHIRAVRRLSVCSAATDSAAGSSSACAAALPAPASPAFWWLAADGKERLCPGKKYNPESSPYDENFRIISLVKPATVQQAEQLPVFFIILCFLCISVTYSPFVSERFSKKTKTPLP